MEFIFGRCDGPKSHDGSKVAGHIDFPHINYTTESGLKSHLEIQEVAKLLMKRYSLLRKDECEIIIKKIVSDFGNGDIKKDKYIFDLINRLPNGYSESKLSASQVVARLDSHKVIYVIFDPNPKSGVFRLQLLQTLDIAEEAIGIETSTKYIAPILSAPDCDFYVTSTNGELLAVGCHEDVWLKNERMMWCPINQRV